MQNLPEPSGPQGSGELSFVSPQPDTSLHCETTNTGTVHHNVCLFTSQLSPVLNVPSHKKTSRLR